MLFSETGGNPSRFNTQANNTFSSNEVNFPFHKSSNQSAFQSFASNKGQNNNTSSQRNVFMTSSPLKSDKANYRFNTQVSDSSDIDYFES